MKIPFKRTTERGLKSALSVLTITAQLLWFVGPAIPLAHADNPAPTPTLATDKPDYFPGEIVHITGTNFGASSDYLLTVSAGNPIDPDYVAIHISVTSDSQGGLAYDYQMDNVYRPLYDVQAVDGSGNVVAQTTFTDAPAYSFDLKQCAQNDKIGNTPLGLGYCNWIGSSLGGGNNGNSQLYEGIATEQQLLVTNITGTTHSMVVGIQATKGGNHAYDWLVSDATASGSVGDSTKNSQQASLADGITLQLNRCGDQLGTQAKADCNALVSGATASNTKDISVPDDPFISVDGSTQSRINAYETLLGNRTIRLYTNAAVTGTPTMALVHMNGKTSGSPLLNGGDTGDSYIWYTINWNGSSTSAMLAAGADIALGGNGTGRSWGAGRGATGISGDPYHFYLINVDGNGGSLDNQMSSSAIFTPPDSPTVATAIHNGSNHATDVQGTTIAIGSTIHDQATVSNAGTNGTPQGTATFQFWNNGTCANTPTATSSALALTNGVVDATGFAQGPLGTGSYSFKASYTSSDSTKWNNAVGSCETVTVGQGTSAIATTLHKADHSVVTVGSSVPLGTVMHDLATVTPSSSFAPTGNVDFRFYTSSADCTNDTNFSGGTTMGSIALNGANPGVAHPSTATGALTPGTYAFKAKWAGDTNYTGNTSSCESFTVNQSTSSVSTELHKADHSVVAVGGHVDLGTIMHDKATVTPDGTIAPTGNVNFTLYPSNDCSGQGTAMGSVALDGANPGVAHPSTSTSALGAGDYSFKATWAGDSNYTGNVSSCENFTVDKAQLSVDTTVHNAAHADITNTHVALGSIVHDTATVSGGVNGFSLPAVSFTLTSGYTGTCTAGDAVANNGTEGNAVKSADSAALGAGAYAYRAVVAGDSNYIGATGVCEPVTVDKAQLTVDTTVHDASHADITNSSVPLGSIVHDTATVTGGVNGFTVPTPTFTLTGSYTNSCANGDAVTNNGTEGSAAKSANSAALGAGMYAYRGAVAGNANYLGDVSDCEPFTVNKAQLTVTTSVHNALHADITNGHVPLGSVVHDTAAVTGGVNGFTVPTPIFTMTQSYNNDCSQGSSVANDGTDVVSGDAKSVDSNALTAGTYAYRGEVIGDNNYEGDVSDCEPFTVDKAQLHISTDIHDAAHASITSAALGSIVHDTAGVTGQVGSITPTGNVTFYFGQGAAQDCKDPNVYPVIATDANLDAGNNHPRSVDTGALAAGGYQFWAHVSGDDNYLGASSDCEPLTINKAQLTVTTIAHNSAHTDVTNTNVPLGSVLHDTATVTGGVSGFTVPTPTFSLTSGYTNSCANGTAVANNGTEGSADKSADSDPLAPGAYAYRASVAGNSNYLGDDSDCEPVTVIQGSSTITTELHEDATHAVITNGGESTTGNVHDSATVMVSPDFAPPSGNVTFRFYGSSAACSADTNFSGGLWSSTVALDGNNPGVAHPSTSTGALSAGTYAFKAKWAGDTNYTGNTSDCEVFTVSTLTINKLANGGNDTFGYTVTGPTNATPDVTTTGAPGQGTKTMVVLAGSYTVGETTMPAGWQFVGLNCAGVNGTTPTSAAFDIPAGTNRVCNFENTKNGATRTQGFWATHTAFANDVWTNDVPTSEKTLCGTKGVIDATAAAGQNELMGGFWSNVAKTSIGSGRSNLEKARIVLLQQLLAAELNRYGLGTNDGGLIAAARTAYCGTNLNAIKTSTGALDTFNQSGDSVPTGFTVPAATPKESKLEANIPFWNTTI